MFWKINDILIYMRVLLLVWLSLTSRPQIYVKRLGHNNENSFGAQHYNV